MSITNAPSGNAVNQTNVDPIRLSLTRISIPRGKGGVRYDGKFGDEKMGLYFAQGLVKALAAGRNLLAEDAGFPKQITITVTAGIQK